MSLMLTWIKDIKLKGFNVSYREFSGGPVVRTPRFHC